MRRNKLLEKLGFAYIANHYSKELHRVGALTSRCRVNKMTHAGYCTRWQYKRLLRRGYNGCRWCNRKEDRG